MATSLIYKLWNLVPFKMTLDDATNSVVPHVIVDSGGSGGSGDASAANQALQITQETAINTALGVQADAAVTNPASAGTLIALTKGVLTKIALLVFGAGTAAAAQRMTLASDDPAVATIGVTSGAAVTTDANGTLQQYLRGLVKTLGSLTNTANAIDVNIKSGVNANGSVAAANSAPVTASTEDVARVGIVTEAAPASDTASSGLNGRLQRIAQNITAMVAATLKVGGNTVVQAASATIARPGDTTAYASGDLVANSVTAGSVNALQFTTLARVSGGSGAIVGAQLQKSTNGVTNAAFRLHLFNTIPTFTSAGDNSALATVVVASGKGYLGYIDITAMVGFSDVAWGSGAPDNSRGSIPYVATAQIIYGILEARGAYAPGNAEVFTVVLDALQD